MSADWLPPPPQPPPFETWQAWSPKALRGTDASGLSYVVVDEIVDATCVLAVSEWPRVDEQGRVRFRLDERPHLVRVAVSELAEYLARHRAAKRGRDRDVRIGDVYAAAARTSLLPEPESEREARELADEELASLEWLEPPVHDITADARDAAKVALSSAVTPVLRRDELKRVVEGGDGET